MARDSMEECRRVLEKIAGLAKIDLEGLDIGELCGYLDDVREMMRGLRESVERYGNPPPLYYVWEGMELPLPRRTVSDVIDFEGILSDRLDEEGRVVLPWRPRR